MSDTHSHRAGREHFRPGFHTLTPYLVVHDAEALVTFLREVFGAEEQERSNGEDGTTIKNAILRIADSMIEVSEARDQWQPRPATLHVYVPDTDATYARAVAAGCRSIYEVADMPYGERSGGVEDRWGNHWYLATYSA